MSILRRYVKEFFVQWKLPRGLNMFLMHGFCALEAIMAPAVNYLSGDARSLGWLNREVQAQFNRY